MQKLFDYMSEQHGITLLSSEMGEIEYIVSEKQGTIEILKELERAETIHPFYPIDPFKQLAIMQEEAGEVTKAILDWQDGKDTVKHVREELIQTAAMCMRMLKNLNEFPAYDTGVSKNQINAGDEIEYSFSKNGNRNTGTVYFDGEELCIISDGTCHSIKDLVDIKILMATDDYVEVRSILRRPNEYKEWTKVSRFLASGLFGVEVREIKKQ